MIKYLPNITLVGAKVSYRIVDPPGSGHYAYIPAVVIEEQGALVRLKCLSKEHPWLPQLDLSDPNHAERLSWRLYLLPTEK